MPFSSYCVFAREFPSLRVTPRFLSGLASRESTLHFRKSLVFVLGSLALLLRKFRSHYSVLSRVVEAYLCDEAWICYGSWQSEKVPLVLGIKGSHKYFTVCLLVTSLNVDVRTQFWWIPKDENDLGDAGGWWSITVGPLFAERLHSFLVKCRVRHVSL